MPEHVRPLAYYPTLDGDVDADRLTKFLAGNEPQNQVLHYAATGGSPEVVTTVAAFANRYGGYLLVGVQSGRDDASRQIVPDAASGVSGDAAAQLQSLCHSQIEPPLPLEIAPVAVTDSQVVLVVRVHPSPTSQPVMVSGQTWVRDNDTNRPATRDEVLYLAATSTYEPARMANPATIAGPNGFPTEVGDDWLTIRGVCTAAPPPGVLVEVGYDVRRHVGVGIDDGSSRRWFDLWVKQLQARALQWAVSGETSASQYDTTLVGLVDESDIIRARIRYGIGSSVAPITPGLWAVVDLSLHLVGWTRHGDGSWEHTRSSETPVPLDDLRHALAAALGESEHVVQLLAHEFPQPRPTRAYLAGAVRGVVAHRVDLGPPASYTQNVYERSQRGWTFLDPEVHVTLGELEAANAANRYIDRFLLDVGAH